MAEEPDSLWKDVETALATKLLAQADEQTRQQRAQRLMWLECNGQPEEGRMLPGLAAAAAFWEAEACFVSGQFLATILLTQVCLEHLLDGALALLAGDEEGNRLSAQRLFERAREKGLLTEEEFQLFDRLRQIRNPHAHPRGVDDPNRLMRRMMDTRSSVDEILLQDAQTAIATIKTLLDRCPFALGPLIQFEEEGPRGN